MKNLLSELKDVSFVILYGTQLGNAQSIAESIFDNASQHELTTRLFALNDVKNIEDLSKLNCPIVIITSTTGDGDPPENADVFWRKIRRKTLKSNVLDLVRYTILGLGDTNFNNFCNCGKQLHKRFQELGATLFHSPGWADDAVGLDLVIDDWIVEFWAAIKKEKMSNHIFLKDSGVSGTEPQPHLQNDNFGGKDFASINKEHNILSASEPRSPKLAIVESEKLSLPTCPVVSLSFEYISKHEVSSPLCVDLQNPPLPYPLIEDSPKVGILSCARCLTKPNAIKTALEVTIQFSTTEFSFEPGDAIGVVCPNDEDEVDALLQRLGVGEFEDKPFTLKLTPGQKGRLPMHIPTKTTLKTAFLYYCDIRTPPKKAIVRLLAEFTAEENEKQKLLQLCSRQGSALFEESIRNVGVSLLDILIEYPSCSPKPEALLQHLPRLIPRAYSISSSPLTISNSLTFAFNIISFPKEKGLKYGRLGVCSGWLYRQAKILTDVPTPGVVEEDLVKSLERIKLDSSDKYLKTRQVVFYKRKNNHFRLPLSVTSPIVMVGPGTGVAPFIGFLQHRFKQKTDQSIGKMILYFGCRHKQRDFLYEDTLASLCQEGTLTQLYTSFSRDEDNNGIKYVQNYMEKNKEELVEYLLDQGGYFYVCGDAQNMAKNVRDKLTDCIKVVKGLTESDAIDAVVNMVSSNRYLQDIWC